MIATIRVALQSKVLRAVGEDGVGSCSENSSFSVVVSVTTTVLAAGLSHVDALMTSKDEMLKYPHHQDIVVRYFPRRPSRIHQYSTNSGPRILIHRLKVKPNTRLEDDDGDAEVVGLLACWPVQCWSMD